MRSRFDDFEAVLTVQCYFRDALKLKLIQILWLSFELLPALIFVLQVTNKLLLFFLGPAMLLLFGFACVALLYIG